MFFLRSRPAFVILTGLAAITLLTWWWNRPDERARFIAEVEEIIAAANRGKHIDLAPKLSPEACARIEQDFMAPGAALAWAARIDSNQNRAYRLANVSVFQPRDYAEVEIERSAPGREFRGTHFFPVPFIWRKGQWWVAGEFRGEREWTYPE